MGVADEAIVGAGQRTFREGLARPGAEPKRERLRDSGTLSALSPFPPARSPRLSFIQTITINGYPAEYSSLPLSKCIA